jgi:prepilin-type N-terminal cleavage/methylation domain-containing protein
MSKNETNNFVGRLHLHGGFTLTETIVVIAILAFSMLLVQTSVMPLYSKSTFRGQVQKFISTLQRASNAASRSNKRYEVIIDLIEQKYILRQISTTDVEDVLDEEILEQNNFGKNCRADYVIFDDLVSTDQQHQTAKFRAGHAGWQYGGKIVLFDGRGQPYSVIVSRISRIIELKNGDVEILLPKYNEEMPF